MSSNTMLCIQLSTGVRQNWRITELGRGARRVLRDARGGASVGLSLAELVHPQDFESLESAASSLADNSTSKPISIRIMCVIESRKESVRGATGLSAAQVAAAANGMSATMNASNMSNVPSNRDMKFRRVSVTMHSAASLTSEFGNQRPVSPPAHYANYEPPMQPSATLPSQHAQVAQVSGEPTIKSAGALCTLNAQAAGELQEAGVLQEPGERSAVSSTLRPILLTGELS